MAHYVHITKVGISFVDIFISSEDMSLSTSNTISFKFNNLRDAESFKLFSENANKISEKISVFESFQN